MLTRTFSFILILSSLVYAQDERNENTFPQSYIASAKLKAVTQYPTTKPNHDFQLSQRKSPSIFFLFELTSKLVPSLYPQENLIHVPMFK